MQKFKDILERYSLKNDRNGIFKLIEDEKYYITNFSQLQFLYTIRDEENQSVIRRIQIGTQTFDLETEQLLNMKAFNKVILSKSNNLFKGLSRDFDNFIQVILALDNQKLVYALSGFGKVGDDIYNLGNIIYTENTFYPFKELIWSGNKGYILNRTDRISVTSTGFTPAEIYNKFNHIFGECSKTVLGFAIAGMFFKSIINEISLFPILYLMGGAGIGKSTFSELLLKLYGVDRSWGTVNCDSNSTKIGVDEKTQEFNNLPLVLNEIGKEYYPMLKARQDGQGSVKASNSKKKKTDERNVKGPTVAVSVALPDDTQVVSRCIIINYEEVKRNKQAFDKLHRGSASLSGFILKIIQKISSQKIITNAEEFKNSFVDKGISSRILESYSIIAGALVALINAYSDITLTKEKIYEHFYSEMKNAEQRLDPLFPLINVIIGLISGSRTSYFVKCENRHIFIYLPGFWSELPKSFKEKHYKGRGHQQIKELLIGSNLIAQYGIHLKSKSSTTKGQKAVSHEKKINKKNYRCMIIVKEKILSQ